MKQLLFLSLILIGFSACNETKKADDSTDVVVKKDVKDSLIIQDDNLLPDGRKLPLLRGKRKPVPQPTPTPSPTPSTGTVVLYFDFNGGLVQNPSWNNGAAFNCGPASLSADARLQALYRVQSDYAAYNVIITSDVSVYNATATTRRQRIIVTDSSGWYPNKGYSGVTFIGCMGTETPCFVFADRLGDNLQYVGAIMTHESGHSLGLMHQGEYGSSCVLTSTYKNGANMGNNLYAIGAWIAQACSNQDDNAVLKTKLGLRI